MNKMKPSGLIRAIMASMLTLGFASCLFYYSDINEREKIVLAEKLYNPAIYEEEIKEDIEEEVISEVPEKVIVYDDLSMEELSDKLNRTLSSDLSNKGESFAKYSIDLGVDPYLATAIAMHETGDRKSVV